MARAANPINYLICLAVAVGMFFLPGLTPAALAVEEPLADSRAGRTYVALHVGGVLPSSIDATIVNSLGPANSGQISMDSSSGGVLALIFGQYLTNRFSYEGFVSYGYFGSWSMEFQQGFAGNPNAGQRRNASGTVQMVGLSLDLQYDLDPITERLRPFVGVGAGMSIFFQKNIGLSGGTFLTNDTDYAFTACLMAGLHYAMSSDVDLTLKYAGVLTTSTKFSSSAGATTYSASIPARFDNTVTVGVRYFLN